MKFPLSIAALGLAQLAASKTLYLLGDSTMARSSDTRQDGWGQYIGNYLTGIDVVNKAIGGRSSRSFTNEGRFTEVANLVQSGDIVVIEFGHNDVGSPNTNDNGRSVCGGTGTEVCYSDKTGEKVYTFVSYVNQAAKLYLSKGATVILSTQTPNNLWGGGVFYGGAGPRFVGFQKMAAQALANPAVTYVDHYQAVYNGYKRLGNSATNAFYIVDHKHTSPQGADFSAKAWAQAIYQSMNGTTSLKNHIKTPVNLVY